MRYVLIVVIAASLLFGGTYVIRGSMCHGTTAGAASVGADEACSKGDGATASSCDPSECAPTAKSATTASTQAGGSRGGVRGAYDLNMAMCRFSCAAKVAYREADLHAQPGVLDGQLARCPVSGVVFKADTGRPRVQLATGEYVTCCDNCAEKLSKDPGRFVQL